MLRMKFSYRVTALVLVVGTLLVVLFSWGTDMTMWDDTSRLTTRTKTTHTSTHNTDLRTVYLGTPKMLNAEEIVGNVDMCAFSKHAPVKTDIETQELLKLLDSDKLSVYEPPANVMPGYETVLNKTGLPLKVFVVPHSHSDPGWLKTVDEYFEDQTLHTLNNMVEKLAKYPKMRFVWAESVFLSLWWEDLSDEVKDQVRGFIDSGQLEIVVGSWVVPDEATTHYSALVNQMIVGHQWLEKTLQVKPKNVWTLDPFGYSSTLPYLYKRAGYDNMVILRVHEQIKNYLQKSRNLEFRWKQHWDINNHTEIFTQMMPYMLYNIKHTCGPDPNVCLMFDFRKIPGEFSESTSRTVSKGNIEYLSKMLLQQYFKKAALFRHNVLLVPLGDDFRFDRNQEWDQQYTNYQKLFDFINTKYSNVEIQFGTVQEYFSEVQKTMTKLDMSTKDFFPSLSGDFFPYTDHDQEYWTGYFTTRPAEKCLGREVEVALRNAEILHTIASVVSHRSNQSLYKSTNYEEMLSLARRNLGLFQHHDAITGTSVAYVVADNRRRLYQAIEDASKIVKDSVTFLLTKNTSRSFHVPELNGSLSKTWHLLNPNLDVLDIPMGGSSNLVLFNSLAQSKQELVRVVVNTAYIEVTDHSGLPIRSQINPLWSSDQSILNTAVELVFVVTLEPLSLTTYKLRRVNEGTRPTESYAAYIKLYNGGGVNVPEHSRFHVRPNVGEGIILENAHVKASFSTTTGFIKSFTTKNAVQTTKTELKFAMYKSRRSGAYIFSPAGPPIASELFMRPLVRVIRGPIVSEVQVLQSLVNHTVRVVNCSGPLGNALEINNIVDLSGMEEKELIMHLDTDIENQDEFYTDSNGFQTMKRKRLRSLAREASYYPMNTHAYIEDQKARLSLVGAQPLGVSSQEVGGLEVMLDRRLLYDDQRGLGEGVLDNIKTASRFYLTLERPSEVVQVDSRIPSPSIEVNLLADTLRHYSPMFTGRLNPDHHLLQHKFLSHDFPCDVNLVNLRQLDGSPHKAALILHKQAFSCDYLPSHLPCSMDESPINIHSAFTDLKVKTVTETSLSLMYKKKIVDPSEKIVLQPMEVYTYRLDLE